MSKSNCEVCRGNGTIRLPLYRQTTASYDPSAITLIEENSRSYPCPECADSIPQERLAVIEFHQLVDSRIKDQAYVEAAKNHAANQLIAMLLKKDFIRFKRGPDNIREFNFPIQATIGVVSPKHVADLESRVSEHQEGLAREVIAEADHQINNWGSYYGHSDILKQDARRLIGEALKDVLAKRSSWKAA